MPKDHIILIVDDDKVFQLYINKIITKAFELKTHIVNNPKEAFEWLTQNEASLITMDMEMPYMDGFTAIKKIRSVDSIKHIPIVACSRLANTDLVVRLIKLKILDYIQKGSPAEVIVRKLSKALFNAGIIEEDKYKLPDEEIDPVEKEAIEIVNSEEADNEIDPGDVLDDSNIDIEEEVEKSNKQNPGKKKRNLNE